MPSGHFTPAQLHHDLTKANVNYNVPIYIYHIKPVYKKKVISELKSPGQEEREDTAGREDVSILVKDSKYQQVYCSAVRDQKERIWPGSKKNEQRNAAPETPAKKVKIPEGLWVKCDNCKEIIYRKEVDKNFKVCPKCDYHFRISASERLPYLVDEGSFLEVEDGLSPKDFLDFKDYKDKLKSNRKKTGLKDAVISGEAKIGNRPVSIVVMDFSFMGGSMGSVVGEKIARAVERGHRKADALHHRLHHRAGRACRRGSSR